MKTKIAALLIVVSVASCKEPYIPPNGSLERPLLVVEANLDPAGTTSITLSRTTNLNDPAVIRTENNAVVTVEGKDNSVFSLINRGNGIYTGNLNLVLNNEYRLRVKNSGKEYLSDWVKTIFNPPLDSISWEEQEDGVHISVNTNDPTHTAKYFRWDYNETWEIRSRYFSEYIYAGGGLRRRFLPAEDVSICWKFSPSTGIFLANSTRLQSGIISRMPIVFIPRGDEKLFVRYSIIAKQYALEEDAYNFFEIMKKNTEDIGSFFGPLPSELKGNIHCLTNPEEPVIGFVTSSAVTQKRIFINTTDVSNWLIFYPCEEILVANHPDSIAHAAFAGWVPIYYSIPPVDKYFFTTPYCGDCRSRGGVNVKPTYW